MKEIVVSRLDNLGDIIMCTPILFGLKRVCPEAKLTFIVPENLADSVDKLSFIDNLVKVPKKRTLGFQLKLINLFKKADLAFLVDYTHRLSLLAFLGRAKQRVGIAHKRGKYLTNAIAWNKEMDNIYDPVMFADVLKQGTGIDITGDPAWCEFHYSEAEDREKQHVEELFNNAGISIKDKYINFALYTGEKAKNWPEENWQELWQRIGEKYPVKIVLTGDNPKGIKFGDNVVDLTGKTTLRELGYIIKNAALEINGCSGPMHIAKAFHTPTIGLYGPTPVAKGAPPNNFASIVTTAICAPCNGDYSSPCDTPFCMGMISVDEVYNVISKFLEQRN